MDRSLKVFITLLITVAALLAASSGYLLASNYNLQKKSSSSSDKKVSDSSAATSLSNETTTSSSDSATTNASKVVAASALDERPSSPSDVVTVASGDTLFSVGQKVGVSWTELALVNGINADKIKIGQTIIVPKNNQVSYTVNDSKVSELQTKVDAGKIQFRLSAIDTAKSDSSPVYGLTVSDSFKQSQIDLVGGSATILATHDGKSYTINLIQPSKKGAKGIWAIKSIKTS